MSGEEKKAKAKAKAPATKQRAITPARLLKHMREFVDGEGRLDTGSTYLEIEAALKEAIVEEAMASG